MYGTDTIWEWKEALSVCRRTDTSFMEVQKGEWVAGQDDFEYIKEMANHIDAQAEENKRMREALDRIRLDEIHNGNAIAALKTDTEEGE